MVVKHLLSAEIPESHAIIKCERKSCWFGEVKHMPICTNFASFATLQLFAKCVTLMQIFDERGKFWDLAKFHNLWSYKVICELPSSHLVQIHVLVIKIECIFTLRPI